MVHDSEKAFNVILAGCMSYFYEQSSGLVLPSTVLQPRHESLDALRECRCMKKKQYVNAYNSIEAARQVHGL